MTRRTRLAAALIAAIIGIGGTTAATAATIAHTTAAGSTATPDVYFHG